MHSITQLMYIALTMNFKVMFFHGTLPKKALLFTKSMMKTSKKSSRKAK